MSYAKELAKKGWGLIEPTDKEALQFALEKIETPDAPKEDIEVVAQKGAPEIVKFGQETLVDESLIYFEGETIGAGTAIFLSAEVDEEGNETGVYSDPAPAGEHTLLDGAVITTNDEGIVEEAPTEPGEDAEPTDDDVSPDEEAATMETLMVAVRDLTERMEAMEAGNEEETEQFASEKKQLEEDKAKLQVEADESKAKAEAFGSQSAAKHHVGGTDSAAPYTKPMHRMNNTERMNHIRNKK